jgi:hypothetical protein
VHGYLNVNVYVQQFVQERLDVFVNLVHHKLGAGGIVPTDSRAHPFQTAFVDVTQAPVSDGFGNNRREANSGSVDRTLRRICVEAQPPWRLIGHPIEHLDDRLDRTHQHEIIHDGNALDVAHSNSILKKVDGTQAESHTSEWAAGTHAFLANNDVQDRVTILDNHQRRVGIEEMREPPGLIKGGTCIQFG